MWEEKVTRIVEPVWDRAEVYVLWRKKHFKEKQLAVSSNLLNIKFVSIL